MRHLLLLAALFLYGCGAAAPTPTAAPTATPVPTVTPAPTPTRPPPPTIAPLQMTVQAEQARQQATVIARQDAACVEVASFYTRAGQVFDRAAASRDPNRALIEFRIVRTGNGAPALSIIGQQMDAQYEQLLWTCLGLR